MAHRPKPPKLTHNQEVVLGKLARLLGGARELEDLQIQLGWGNPTFWGTLDSLQKLKYVSVGRRTVHISSLGRKAYLNRKK